LNAEAPRVSVIVVSRDRAVELEQALAAIEAQRLSVGSFEIVVVDAGSTDRTGEMLAARWQSPSGRWASGRTVIRVESALRPGAARNLAVERARGAFVAFTDSDCRPEEGWLEELLLPFEDPQVGAVGGREVDDPTEPALARAVHFAMTSPLTTGRVRGGRGLRVGRFRPRSFNMAARRELCQRAGGFADTFYGEDVDLSLRIERLGFVMVFAPGASVHHRRRCTLQGIAQQAYSMGAARARLMRSDRGHREVAYLLPPLALLSVVALLLAATWVPAVRPAVSAVGAIAALYLVAVSWQARRASGDLRVALRAPAVFALQQSAYGLGLLAGVVRGTLPA
jgi:cellulose synthase/poly-beta-1,6-N-acetylglucosamine synthase-like glycosyltransferase